MWWKLTALCVVTMLMIVSIVPIRTHAVAYDPGGSPSVSWSLSSMMENMYLTPGSAALIVLILLFAGYAALRIIRRHR